MTQTKIVQFDPADPFCAMVESFRRQVTLLAVDAQRTTIFRELPADRQLSAFIAGVSTALASVCLAHTVPADRDKMMQAVADYWPAARGNAEAAIAELERLG